MNLGKLNEKCPKCGCKDKILKRDIILNIAHMRKQDLYAAVNVDMFSLIRKMKSNE